MPLHVVYILSSFRRVLYIGVTSDLKRRVWEHREKVTGGFTARYAVNRLVYYECHRDVWAALAREKELKLWRRARKIDLITAENPEWRDLYDAIDRRAGARSFRLRLRMTPVSSRRGKILSPPLRVGSG